MIADDPDYAKQPQNGAPMSSHGNAVDNAAYNAERLRKYALEKAIESLGGMGSDTDGLIKSAHAIEAYIKATP